MDYFDVILLYLEGFYFRFKPQRKIDEVVTSFEIENIKGVVKVNSILVKRIIYLRELNSTYPMLGK